VNQRKLVVIGAGGHAHSVLSLIDRLSQFNPVALVDTVRPNGDYVYGLPIISSLEQLADFCSEQDVSNLCVAIGDNFQREAMTERLNRYLPDSQFPILVDPTAVVASDAILDPGVVVMAQAHVGAGCRLAAGCLVNTQASVDHDSSLSRFSSLAPGVITGGHVRIGERSFIGLGGRIIHGITVGNDTVVGAGSLVLEDQPSSVLSYGAPAQVIRTRQPYDRYL
jgi:sugar O-acyltransferase (sialic acid O-acetyltransferase NeuD family)